VREPERVPSPPSIQSSNWSAAGLTPRRALHGVGLIVLVGYAVVLSRSGATDTSVWAMAAILVAAFA
jgi:hypothetical protein